MEYFVYSVFFILTVPRMVCETQAAHKDLLITLPVLNYL